MLCDIHFILHDIIKPQAGKLPSGDVSKETMLSKLDLNDLEHIVRYLENRICFYEGVYGCSEPSIFGDVSVSDV